MSSKVDESGRSYASSFATPRLDSAGVTCLGYAPRVIREARTAVRAQFGEHRSRDSIACKVRARARLRPKNGVLDPYGGSALHF
jgi:hypothetical protein